MISDFNKQYTIELLTDDIIHKDALSGLKIIPDNSVDMCITSPPYYGLRSYETQPLIWDGDDSCDHEWSEFSSKGMTGGTKSNKVNIKGKDNFQKFDGVKQAICTKCNAWYGELGHEYSLNLFVKHLADIFDEVQRVLKPTGSFFLNIGDSMMGSTKFPKYNKIKNKSLMMIPERIAMELVDNRGWILRNTIVWEKPNSMPESPTDRFNKSWEYLFFFTKNEKYYFEQQLEKSKDPELEKRLNSKRKDVESNHKNYKHGEHSSYSLGGHSGYFKADGSVVGIPGLRNVRDVWEINVKGFTATKFGDFDVDHFAVFPEELIRKPISACVPTHICENCGNPRLKVYKKMGESSYENMKGKDTSKYRSHQGQNQNMRADRECYERPVTETYIECGCTNPNYTKSGIVLDPFFGAGTTGIEALRQGKHFVGVELNEKFIQIAEARLADFKTTDEMMQKRMSENLQKII